MKIQNNEVMAEQGEKYSQGLEFSESLGSFGEQLAYSNLDEFVMQGVNTSAQGENDSENDSESDGENSPKMTDEDSVMIAAGAMGQLEALIAPRLDFPLVIDDRDREKLSIKTGALVKKYMGKGDVPTWLKLILEKYKEEFEFGMALAGVGFGVYKQRANYLTMQQQEAEKTNVDGVVNYGS